MRIRAVPLASLNVTLPPMAEKHDAYGWWLQGAGLPEPRPALDGDVDADVVIVGGGYTGMWAAWFVSELEPEATVVVLEADRCGMGPSGRNGGVANSMWPSLGALPERVGVEGAPGIAPGGEAGGGGVGGRGPGGGGG